MSRRAARPGAGVSAKGEERLKQILEAARSTLIEEGYHGLTMRAVADRCGITVGNLTYYYATKQHLLRDLLTHVRHQYELAFEEVLAGVPSAPRDQLEAIVRYIFSDLGSPETTAFFPELWAMANHDEDAAHFMDEIYRWEREVLGESIAAMRPDLSRAVVRRLALFASATMEGHTMFVGHGKSHARQRRAAENVVVSAIMHVVENTPQAGGKA